MNFLEDQQYIIIITSLVFCKYFIEMVRANKLFNILTLHKFNTSTMWEGVD